MPLCVDFTEPCAEGTNMPVFDEKGQKWLGEDFPEPGALQEVEDDDTTENSVSALSCNWPLADEEIPF